MKDFFKILLIVAVCIVIGARMQKCQSPQGSNAERPPGAEADTVTYVDTIPYYEPTAKSTAQLGYKFITIPYYSGFGYSDTGDTLPRIRADTEVGEIIIDADAEEDSMRLGLPMVQNVYEDTAYRAYVSGVYPRLDSIYVYPTREVVTINKPPKRWHIGPTVGYGLTPQGFQPYIGVSVTYSLLSW